MAGMPEAKMEIPGQFSWRIRVSWWLTDRVVPWLRPSQESYFERLEHLIQPGMRVLDIGCGEEFLVSWLRPDLYRRWTVSIVEQAVIFGIDPLLQSLRENPSRRKACALAAQLPFRDSSFDLITANMVAEHLAAPEPAMQEIARLLPCGGCFLFHTPNFHTPLIWLGHSLPYAFKRMIVQFLEPGGDKSSFRRTIASTPRGP